MAAPDPNSLLSGISEQYIHEFTAEVARADTMLAAQRISDAGQSLEIALSRFLAKLLPTHVGIGRGHVASRDWTAVSEEIDIVLYDRRYAAGFPYLGDVSAPGDHLGVFSADAVLGCIAVTKTLTKAKLEDSLRNLATATELCPPDLRNQLHYDLPLDGGINYRGGVLLNPVLSAVVAYTDDIFTSIDDGMKAPSSGRKLDLKLDALTEIEGFCGGRTDLIYTLDGVILYPMLDSPDGFRHPPPESWIGQPKECIVISVEEGEPRSEVGSAGHAPVLLFDDYRGGEESGALKLFLVHLVVALSSMVKRTPNYGPLIAGARNRKLRAPMSGRVAAEKLLTEKE